MRRTIYRILLTIAFCPVIAVLILITGLGVLLIVNVFIGMFIGSNAAEWFINSVNETIVYWFNNYKTLYSWVCLIPTWFIVIYAQEFINQHVKCGDS